MSVNQQLVEWIRKQIDAGYTLDYIRYSLQKAGWFESDINEAINVAMGQIDNEVMQTPPQPVMEEMGMIDKFIRILTHPQEFFQKVRGETGMADAFIYVLAIVGLMIPINAILSYLFMPSLGMEQSISGMGFGAGYHILHQIILGVFILFSVLMGAAIVHIFVIMFGGKNGFHNTFKAFAYSGTPYYLLLSVPYINLIAFLWSTILEVLGIKTLQDMSTGKAVLCLVLPGVVIGLIFLIIALVFGLMLFTMFAGLSASQSMPVDTVGAMIKPLITMVR